MKESELQKLILDYLIYQKCFVMRMNTGATKIGDRFIRFGKAGMSDIYMLHGGRSYWIECKATKGKLSSAQIEFQKDIIKNGGVAITAYKIEDIMSLFEYTIIK